MTLAETAQLLGNFGEFFGAIAVVATLIFLAVQIRLNKVAMNESNDLARAAAVDQIFDQFKGLRRLIASDSDVARVWLTGRQGDTLDPIDNLRFENLAVDYIVIYSNWANRGLAIGSRGMQTSAIRVLAENIAEHPGLNRIWQSGVGVQRSFKRSVNEAVAHMQVADAA